jgi:hypothetical protein
LEENPPHPCGALPMLFAVFHTKTYWHNGVTHTTLNFQQFSFCLAWGRSLTCRLVESPTPRILWQHDGEHDLMHASCLQLMALDPKTGHQRWYALGLEFISHVVWKQKNGIPQVSSPL